MSEDIKKTTGLIKTITDLEDYLDYKKKYYNAMAQVYAEIDATQKSLIPTLVQNLKSSVEAGVREEFIKQIDVRLLQEFFLNMGAIVLSKKEDLVKGRLLMPDEARNDSTFPNISEFTEYAIDVNQLIQSWFFSAFVLKSVSPSIAIKGIYESSLGSVEDKFEKNQKDALLRMGVEDGNNDK
jgi:hypothetical protein